MPANPAIPDTFKAPYAVSAPIDADGNMEIIPAGDTITVVSSAPASLTVTPDAAPAAGTIQSGFLVGGKTLATGVTVTVTVQKADGTPDATIANNPTVDTFDVVATTAGAVTFAVGTAVPQ